MTEPMTIPVLDKRLEPRSPTYDERMLLANLNTVGELRDALKGLTADTPIEVRTPYADRPPFQTARLRLEEATLHDDGHVVLYASP